MTSCSGIARSLGEPLAGTAPQAAVWVALEQAGPWGRTALLDSRLDRSVGAELTARAAALPVRPLLIRRPGPRQDAGTGASTRTLLVARATGVPRLWRAVLDDPRQVLDLDLEALVHGGEPALGRPDRTAVLLVCTNGRRDACCARYGRAAVAELAAAGHEVWESSHVGGHRFSPTVLRLPDAWVFGGTSATQLTTVACRGRTALSPAAQAAELAVLTARGSVHPAPLSVTAVGRDRFDVDGVPVRVRNQPVVADRPESCGAGPLSAVAPVASLSP